MIPIVLGISILMLTGCNRYIVPLHEDFGEVKTLGGCPGDAKMFRETNSDGTLKLKNGKPVYKPYKDWEDIYHKTVSRIVSAHIRVSDELRPLQCDAEDFKSMFTPSPQLVALASKLPPWDFEKNKSQLGLLSEADMGSVLLEFLREYECVLKDNIPYVRQMIQREIEEEAKKNKEEAKIGFEPLEVRVLERKIDMRDELNTARKSLERTLAFVNGIDRLRPLSLELICIQRTSLDIRNIFGLAAEAISCLPRIWDTQGSLRDLN
jgi:hypothetical protein